MIREERRVGEWEKGRKRRGEKGKYKKKAVAFLYTSNEQLEFEMKNVIYISAKKSTTEV